MKLHLNPKFIFTFLALTFVMHEAHEIAHTAVGRVICGCWGLRDFNVWETCKSCVDNPLKIWSTVMGPLFTFIMIRYGSSLINLHRSDHQKAFGFSLIFANMPFARLLNPILGGGDEVVVVNNLIKNHELARVFVVVLILLIIYLPLLKAYKMIENKNKTYWFLGFFILPTFIDLLIVLGLMNTLLNKGVLAEYWILGSPILVTAWTAAVLLIYLLTRKNIYSLIKNHNL
jgi:hypothetical protein